MINTIFYFVDQESTYKNMLQNNEISSHTIVFAADRGSIYKNGIRYGGVRGDELQQLLNDTNWHDTVESHLENIDNLIEGLNSNINSLVIYNEEQIGDMINSAFEEYDWLKKKFSDVDWGEIFKWSEWNDKMSQYLAGIGVITESGAKWTELKADVNSIKTSITNIDGNEVLNSHLEQYIEDKIAGLNLSATYAKIEDLNNLSGDLEDLSAEIANKASLDLLAGYVTKASLTAYAKTSDVDTKIGTVETKIDNLTDTVTTSLSSTVRDYIEDELGTDIQKYLSNTSGVITEATLDQAVAALFSNSSSETSGELSSFTSSFATQSDLQNATASMVVTSDLNNYVKRAGVIAAINNSGESNVTIDADKINIGGIQINANQVTGIDSIVANNITSDMISSKLATIGGFTVDNYGLYASGSNGSSIRIDSDGTIRSVGQNRTGSRGVVEINEGVLSIRTLTGDVELPVCEFQDDGSGMLANGAISWDSAGNLEVDKNFISSLFSIGHGGYRVASDEIYFSESGLVLNQYNGTSDSDPIHILEIRANGIQYSPGSGSDTAVRINEEGIEANRLRAEGYIIGRQFELDDENNDSYVTVDKDLFQIQSRNFESDVNLVVTSDERKKDIIATVEPSINDISNVRIVDYKLKNGASDSVHLGSIAQDWQNIYPSAITKDKDGYLGLDYASVALASAVTAAREIVNLKRENELLKQRLDSIEERLGIN